MKTIYDSQQLDLCVRRLAQQLLESHDNFKQTVIVGLQPRGTPLARRIVQALEGEEPRSYPWGYIDITFYRDDLRGHKRVPNGTQMQHSTEGKRVVLIDDVLYTGRTVRAALDALMDFGRPAAVELLVLIDRRFNRELPIQPDYTGKRIDTIDSQRVKVSWAESDGADSVVLLNEREP